MATSGSVGVGLASRPMCVIYIANWECPMVATRTERTVRTMKAQDNRCALQAWDTQYHGSHRCTSLPPVFLCSYNPARNGCTFVKIIMILSQKIKKTKMKEKH